MAYAGYWQRFNAGLIDGVLVAIAYATVFLVAKSWIVYAFTFSRSPVETELLSGIVIYVLTGIGLLIDMGFFVVLPKLYGGTPGQFFMGIRLTMRDCTKPSLNAVMLKHCVTFLLLIVALLCSVTYALVPFATFEYEMMHYIIVAGYGWLFLNLFVMACSKSHRSLADFIADTAVVDKAAVKEGYVYIYADQIISAVPEALMEKVSGASRKKPAKTDNEPPHSS